jgi:hypothetical protein
MLPRTSAAAGEFMKLALDGNVQGEMREAFYDGAPGILVSGLVWAAAALTCYLQGVENGVWTLLIGGVIISPLANLLTKALGRSAASSRGNPLTTLAVASTVWLIVCCAMAFGLTLHSSTWFFPAMMAVIGSRYMVFATIFGRAAYWALGCVLVVAGVAATWLRLEPSQSAALGSLIEISCAVVVFRSAGKQRAI